MAERDPYEVLSVEPQASEEEARAAWRRLVSIYHPDQHAHKAEDVRAEAERRMAGVNEAYQSIVRGDGRVPRREPPPPTPPAPPPAPSGPEPGIYPSELRARARSRARMVSFTLFGAFAVLAIAGAFAYLTGDFIVTRVATDPTTGEQVEIDVECESAWDQFGDDSAEQPGRRDRPATQEEVLFEQRPGPSCESEADTRTGRALWGSLIVFGAGIAAAAATYAAMSRAAARRRMI